MRQGLVEVTWGLYKGPGRGQVTRRCAWTGPCAASTGRPMPLLLLLLLLLLLHHHYPWAAPPGPLPQPGTLPLGLSPWAAPSAWASPPGPLPHLGDALLSIDGGGAQVGGDHHVRVLAQLQRGLMGGRLGCLDVRQCPLTRRISRRAKRAPARGGVGVPGCERHRGSWGISRRGQRTCDTMKRFWCAWM